VYLPFGLSNQNFISIYDVSCVLHVPPKLSSLIWTNDPIPSTCITVRIMMFSFTMRIREPPLPTPRLDYHSLSAVGYCLFYIFADNPPYVWVVSYPRNPRTHLTWNVYQHHCSNPQVKQPILETGTSWLHISSLNLYFSRPINYIFLSWICFGIASQE